MNATNAAGKTKAKYGATNVKAVLAHMRAHGGDDGTKPVKRSANTRVSGHRNG